jgi:conjugative transposon TraM protein
MEKSRSLKELRHRKMLLILPLLVLPFLTLTFWALGGGGMETSDVLLQDKGFNNKLPSANLKEGMPLDKMNYYEQAALDSAKREELIRKDPNYLSQSLADTIENDTVLNQRIYKNRTAMNTTSFQDPRQERVYQKLEALQKAINRPVPSLPEGRITRTNDLPLNDYESSDGNKQLEEMMQSMGASSDPDPEMQQISGMLENILDIQHPERVREKLRKASQAEQGQVFPIATQVIEDNISSLQSPTGGPVAFGMQVTHNAFYSLDGLGPTGNTQNAVGAVIHETQTIVNGSIVKLRLTNDIYINGIRIPRDNFLFGEASLKGERLSVKITSIRYGNSIFPVDLSVYDMDGLGGIYIPGAINRDVAKASADRSMQTLGVTTLDDSWGAQAAGVGIEAAKSLFSKKVKLIKVVVKAGYQVLLKDEKQKQKDSN